VNSSIKIRVIFNFIDGDDTSSTANLVNFTNKINPQVEEEILKRGLSIKSSSFMQKTDLQVNDETSTLKPSSRFLDHTYGKDLSSTGAADKFPQSHIIPMKFQTSTQQQIKQSTSSSSIANISSNYSNKEEPASSTLANQESVEDDNDATSLGSNSSLNNAVCKNSSNRNLSNNNSGGKSSSQNKSASMIKSGKNTIQIIQDGDDIRINIDGKIKIVTSRNSDRRMISFSPQTQRRNAGTRSSSKIKSATASSHHKKVKSISNHLQPQSNDSKHSDHASLSLSPEEMFNNNKFYQKKQNLVAEDTDIYVEKENCGIKLSCKFF
jgi:hypothetical protein